MHELIKNLAYSDLVATLVKLQLTTFHKMNPNTWIYTDDSEHTNYRLYLKMN